MWLENYGMNLLENVGWEDETVFFDNALQAAPGQTLPKVEQGICLPLKSLPDGRQALLRSADCIHSLVSGTTGSGKSRRWFMPAVLAAMAGQNSMLVLDVKGEIYAHTKALIRKKNYRSVVINLRDTGRASDGFNPLHKVARLYKQGMSDQAERVLTQLAEALFPPLPANSTQDPFWRRSSMNLFCGTAAYLGEVEPEKLTLAEIDRFISQYFTDDDSTVSAVTSRLKKNFGDKSYAFRNWYAAASGSDRTRQNVLTSFQALFSEFVGDSNMMKLTSRHAPALDNLADPERPTIVYVQLNDASTANYALARIIFEQLYESLREQGAKQPDRRLPRHFAFFMDEIANAAKISALPTMLAMARSSNISIHLGVQSLSQLDEVYGANAAEIIKSNLGLIAVLNTQDAKTWAHVSTLCGVNVLGETLIPAYRLARMKLGEVLFMRKGMRPFFSELSDVTASPFFCGCMPG